MLARQRVSGEGVMAIGPADPPNVKDTIRQYWSERAPEFDQGPSHGLLTDTQAAAWRERVRVWAGSGPLDALDVGCGTGFLALLLAEIGNRVVGVDAANQMLAQARAKAAAAGLTVNFRSGDVERLALGDASFDLVVERHVIWTLPDPAVALAEWSRVLRPGGRLILVEGDWGTNRSSGYDEATRAALPLYGGRPSNELIPWVAQAGLIDPRVESLSDAALWGGVPDRERYALHARRSLVR
jgi:ubiquinone/menaquinone biosynthesis C-methylase UbiE